MAQAGSPVPESGSFHPKTRATFKNEGGVFEKLKVICHAEQNAILNAARVGVAIEGGAIFVTKFPCLTCCNAMIQAGIIRIYTHDEWYWNDDPFDRDHSRKKDVLRQAHIKVDAPYHRDYSPQEPTNPKKKNGAMRASKIPVTTRTTAEGDQGNSASRESKNWLSLKTIPRLTYI